MFKYMVSYIANDGHPCSFTFKSETVLRSTFNCYCKLHEEMWEAAKRIMAKEESSMARHGGFDGWYGLRKIENTNTGNTVYFR